MPVVQISIVSGRSPEQVRNLIREVSRSVSSTLDAAPDSVKVIVTEVAPEHWGSGTETIAERRQGG